MKSFYQFEKGNTVRVVTPREDVPEIKAGAQGQVRARRANPDAKTTAQYLVKFYGYGNLVCFNEAALVKCEPFSLTIKCGDIVRTHRNAKAALAHMQLLDKRKIPYTVSPIPKQ